MVDVKVLTIANLKGGVGKTISSVNIAGAMAEKYGDSKDIILIDLDPQGNASQYLGFFPNNIDLGTKELLDEHEYTIEDVINETKVKNLYIIPSEISLINIEFGLLNNKQEVLAPTFILNEKINRFRKTAKKDTLIIIDTKPDFGTFTMNALMASDRVLCPIEPCPFSLHGIDIMISNIGYIREKFNRRLRLLGIFKNNWNKSNTGIIQEIENECDSNSDYNRFLLETRIVGCVDIEKSKKEHLPLVCGSFRKKASIYKDLVNEIENKWERIVR